MHLIVQRCLDIASRINFFSRGFGMTYVADHWQPSALATDHLQKIYSKANRQYRQSAQQTLQPDLSTNFIRLL